MIKLQIETYLCSNSSSYLERDKRCLTRTNKQECITNERPNVQAITFSYMNDLY